MKHVVLTMEDGTTAAVPVNDRSTVNVRTWAPPNASDGMTLPTMTDDQTFSLAGVASVTLEDDAPPQAYIPEPPAELAPPVEKLTQEQSEALDAQWVTEPAPWEED